MKNISFRWMTLIAAIVFIIGVAWAAETSHRGMAKGIYLTQSTLENTNRLLYLIRNAKATGINTFVIDIDRPSKKYQKNIQLVKENKINYVARVTIFPNGGTPDQVKSRAYWEKKYALIQHAINYGAHQIQLDYIRYNTKQPPSSQNAKDIHNVIRFYKERVEAYNIPLQIDVFGIASFGESKYIGHNIKLFANSIDVLCPMVYPSHYQPFPKHMATPYETVYDSLVAIKAQFKNNRPPFKINPFIEISNYHYPLSQEKKIQYVRAQIRAVQDAGADGWYVWSAHNQYDTLFKMLSSYPVK